MDAELSQKSLSDQLILAGIEELATYGVHNFSLRRVAGSCGVSCAAPYKHFKDKQNLINAIIGYIDNRWSERRRAVTAREDTPVRRLILDIALEYIRFLVDNHHFIPIVMMRHDNLGERYSALRGHLSLETYALVDKYCNQVQMPEDVRRRKIYVMRSLIYGAVLMCDNGEMPYTEETLQTVRCLIDREFDLP